MLSNYYGKLNIVLKTNLLYNGLSLITNLSEPIPLAQAQLVAGGGAWSSLSLMGQAFLTPHGNSFPLGRVDGGIGLWGRQGDTGGAEGGRTVVGMCKMKFSKIIKKR